MRPYKPLLPYIDAVKDLFVKHDTRWSSIRKKGDGLLQAKGFKKRQGMWEGAVGAPLTLDIIRFGASDSAGADDSESIIVLLGVLALRGERQPEQPFELIDLLVEPSHGGTVLRFEARGGVEIVPPHRAVPACAVLDMHAPGGAARRRRLAGRDHRRLEFGECPAARHDGGSKVVAVEMAGRRRRHP